MEGGQGLKSTAIFEELKSHVTSIPDIVKKVKAIFLWNITKAGKRAAQWSECLHIPHWIYMYIMMPFLYVHCTVNIVGLGTYHTISCVFTLYHTYIVYTSNVHHHHMKGKKAELPLLIVGYLSWNLYHNCDMRSSINSWSQWLNNALVVSLLSHALMHNCQHIFITGRTDQQGPP